MKRFVRSVNRALDGFGINAIKMIYSLLSLPAYFRDLKTLKKQKRSAAKEIPFGRLYPCLSDRFESSGTIGGHYFHQDLLVARKIYQNKPERHVDIGSRIDGFVAHVAAFRSIEVLDIRPLSDSIPNIKFKQVDFMAPLDKGLVDYCDSLSCLHAMEHFGLGRYGDPISYDGYIFGLENLYLMLKQGGKLYFSVPIGPLRIEFNAQRVFSVNFLLDCFNGKYHVDQFSYVDDQGALNENVPLSDTDINNNFGCRYGCGIFEMSKL